MHHRTPTGTTIRPAAVGTLASAACLVAGVALAGPAAAAAVPNTVFQIGVGSSPGLAIGSDGTAYIAFDHNQNVSSDDDTVQLCRIPRGHRGCASLTTIALPDLGVGGDGPKVFLPAAGTVEIISSRESPTTTTNDLIYTVTSTDNGATFGSPVALGPSGVTAPTAIAIGNGRFASISRSTTAGTFVEAYGPAGTAPDTNAAPISSDEYGGTLARTSDGSLLAGHYDSPAGTPNVASIQRYAGSGPISSPASWSTVFTTGASETQLVSGPSGTYLFDRRDSDTRFEVRKWTGATFGAPSLPGVENGDDFGANLDEDSQGRLNIVYRHSGALVVISSLDGAHFSSARGLVPDLDTVFIYNPRAAEIGDGGGFATFDSNGDGKVYAVAIPLIRQISGKVAHGKVSGTDKGAVKDQPVLLQEKGKHGYVTVASSKFQAHGAYSFAVPKHTATLTLRVLAPAVEGYAPDQSKPITVKA